MWNCEILSKLSSNLCIRKSLIKTKRSSKVKANNCCLLLNSASNYFTALRECKWHFGCFISPSKNPRKARSQLLYVPLIRVLLRSPHPGTRGLRVSPGEIHHVHSICLLASDWHSLIFTHAHACFADWNVILLLPSSLSRQHHSQKEKNIEGASIWKELNRSTLHKMGSPEKT